MRTSHVQYGLPEYLDNTQWPTTNAATGRQDSATQTGRPFDNQPIRGLATANDPRDHLNRATRARQQRRSQ
jgi:hypothetical protein